MPDINLADAVVDQAIETVTRARNDGEKQPNIQSFFDKATHTISHIVADNGSGSAIIIDSVLDYDPASGRTSYESANLIIEYVKSNKLEIEWHLETHAHADHLSAAPYLQDVLGGKIAIGEHIQAVQKVFGKLFNAGAEFERDGSQFDHLLKDGDNFNIGNLDVVVMHVPGHTPADLAFVIGDAVFAGDTLFMPDYGTARADFPGGDARKLYQSIRRVLSLPDETRLFLCHDYLAPGRETFEWETTVGAQRAGNVHVHDGVSEDEFAAMRIARDATLNMPTLILPAIQVNIKAGHLPEPEDNGIRYLKIPLDAL